jgi:hypothetical protein
MIGNISIVGNSTIAIDLGIILGIVAAIVAVLSFIFGVVEWTLRRGLELELHGLQVNKIIPMVYIDSRKVEKIDRENLYSQFGKEKAERVKKFMDENFSKTNDKYTYAVYENDDDISYWYDAIAWVDSDGNVQKKDFEKSSGKVWTKHLKPYQNSMQIHAINILNISYEFATDFMIKVEYFGRGNVQHCVCQRFYRTTDGNRVISFDSDRRSFIRKDNNFRKKYGCAPCLFDCFPDKSVSATDIKEGYIHLMKWKLKEKTKK